MNTKLLKQRILDLAIHGRLVPQNPDDEPASQLLRRISEEKEKLIAQGKIKRPKKSDAINPAQECPFEIPNSWEWVKLGEIFSMQAGKNISSNEIHTEKSNDYPYPCYGGNGIRGYVQNYNVDGNFVIIGRQGALCGNVQMASGLFYATEHAVVTYSYAKTDIKWVYYFLTELNLNQYATATAQPGLAVSKILEVFIPLPPLAEQQRIVSAIEKWFSLIDEIETNKESLQAAIKQTKSKVLDLAIKGNLVSQDINDEPAKIDSIEITNETPFVLPDNWKWVKGADIFKPMQNIKPEGDFFYYVDIDAIDNKKNIILTPKYLKVDKAPSRARRQVSKGDILFSMVRPYLRNIAKVDKDNYIASTGFYVCKPNNNITSNFCFYLMISDDVVNGLNQYMKGDNSPSINNENIQQFLFPLPPLSEQTRIVSKIEEIFALLDEIERELA